VLIHLARQKVHPREPQVVSCPLPIPFIGHLVLMALQGGHYIRTLGLAHPHLPAFTLVVPFARLYIITSPPLAVAIQRRPVAQLSSNALLPSIVKRAMGLDDRTADIVSRGLDPISGGGGGVGVLAELHAMLTSYLGPGTPLDELTVGSAKELAAELDEYVRTTNLGGNNGPTAEVAAEEDLLPWARRLVVRATSRVLYGSRNPLATASSTSSTKEDLERAFWDFDHGLGRLVAGVLPPSFVARKAYRGREMLTAAFKEYIDAGHYEPTTSSLKESGGNGDGAAPIILNRIRIARAHGFSADGVARSEVSFLFAAIVNTATVAFWVLARVCSDPKLLALIRSELDGIVVKNNKEPSSSSHDRKPTRQLSSSALTAHGCRDCPTLWAVYRETLRLGSNNFSTRLVKEDTVVTAAGLVGEGGAEGGGGYFLQRGGIVQIAGGVMHMNRAIWGEDAAEFQPLRHLAKLRKPQQQQLKRQGEATLGSSAVHPAAFRGFGGGRTLCPGRHFATGEILGFVACVLLRFEIQGVGGGG
ncbi:cytochrome P450, partial [Cryphonectria parasitica EP155]